MGRNCSLKVQVLYTASFPLTGVSLWSLSIHCRHGGVFERANVWASVLRCVRMRVTVFFEAGCFHSFTGQVLYEVRISESDLDQNWVRYLFLMSTLKPNVLQITLKEQRIPPSAHLLTDVLYFCPSPSSCWSLFLSCTLPSPRSRSLYRLFLSSLWHAFYKSDSNGCRAATADGTAACFDGISVSRSDVASVRQNAGEADCAVCVSVLQVWCAWSLAPRWWSS